MKIKFNRLISLKLVIGMLLSFQFSFAQNTFPSTGSVGIGTTSPNASALLDVTSIAKGVLIPRMTAAQRNTIASPATGLLIYQTNNTPGFYFYNGNAWKPMISKTTWNLNGNTGIDPAINFIGTLDNEPINFRVNNTNTGSIQTDGQIFLGLDAGIFNTGLNNTAIGGHALESNSSGSYNTANGNQALDSNTTGQWNTATGFRSLYFNKTGLANTANGEEALFSSTSGNYNTGIGLEALFYDSTGSGNTAIGQDALFNNGSGNSNTANGVEALDLNATGSDNTGDGNFAGPNVDNLSNTTALGEYTVTTADDQVRLGSNDVTSIGGYVDWTNISDGRVKKNIKPNVPGLIFINKLNPITYNLDLDAADKIIQRPALKDKSGKPIQPSQFEIDSRNSKEQIVYTGFIAQDVEKTAKSLNYDFSGVDAAKNNKDLYGLRYSDFVVPLVKAVQELSVKNDSLQAENNKQQIINNELGERLTKLEAMMNIQNTITNISSASLEQNIPNPFKGSTMIGYILPANYSSAQIIIRDNTGKTLKAITVSGNGHGSLNIDAATISDGAYNYSLMIDGRMIDTKKMVLAK